MDKKLTRQDLEAFQRGASLMVGAIVDGLRRLAQVVETTVDRFSAPFQAAALEAQGRKCKDRRKRNRYFRKAKRLKARYQVRPS